MDNFRLRAFFVLHEEDIRYVLEPWIRCKQNGDYHYSEGNQTVMERQKERGLVVPFRHNDGENSWVPAWRLFLALVDLDTRLL